MARRIGETVELPQSALTSAAGTYGLWFGDSFEHHALIGAVERTGEQRVIRRLLSATVSVPTEPFEAQWTGHVMHSPSEIDAKWEDVTVPLRDGTAAPAWLFRSADSGAAWVIHVQGIRTSRLVTLRSVEAAERAGHTSLVITYRGAGDGPATAVSSLGQHEWSDLADAVEFARSHGAPEVYVVAWSMGAGIALELLRRDPKAFERLALVAPATNWRRIVRRGVDRAGMPGFVAPIVTWALGSAVGSRVIGMPAPLDFDRLDWSNGFSVEIPTLVLHSKGDEEIPFELTEEFAVAHPNVTLVETKSAPHGWEANVDPELFQSTLTSWLSARSPHSHQ
ncbi:alpha/beta hydrolase family protein [Microbacterium rhizosphaerae]|uniref:Alpha/beta fold hydrolase n=1 Tax=Microbacterium rhizosphaerae TaxID=1678237 RepID=A0ABZ0SSM4_9MICO|nr:alpha/beta fold hydrolase [Microbacterium rhizosphaerae]WPR91311.1 alpha/beta fold hydrolase [Microbacterium rhizosphaerae]